MSKFDYDAIVENNIDFLNRKRLKFRKITSKKDIRIGNKRLVGMLSMAKCVENKKNKYKDI